MKRIDKIKNMTTEEMAKQIIKLNITDEYCRQGVWILLKANYLTEKISNNSHYK